jgi:formylglycine-generating enzyme required for sulfatase activity
MVRRCEQTFLIYLGLILFLGACQSPVLPGDQVNNSSTQTAAITTVMPTMIISTATPTQIPATPTQANFKTSEIDQMDMIYIPAGEFIMGTDDIEAQRILEGNGRQYPEIPTHNVTLDGFWIDKFEFTNEQYQN